MNVKDFEYLTELAKAGSISGASKALYISQPALSKYLQKLEDEAGTPLFQHVGRQLVPTYAGEKCIQTAKEILYLHNQMLDTLSDITRQNSGQIKLGLPLSRGNHFISVILPQFYEKFPGICINIHQESMKILVKMLRRGELNLVYGNISETHEELQYDPISEEEMVLAVPASYHLSDKGVRREPYRFPCLKKEDWENLPFLMLNEDQASRIYADDYLGRHHITPKTVLKVRNLAQILFSVKQGLGITICPSLPILSDNIGNQVDYFSLPDENGLHIRQTAVMYRKDAYLSVAEKYLIQIIRENYCSSSFCCR